MAYDEIAAKVVSAVSRYGSDRVAIILGTSTGGIERTEETFRHYQESGTLDASYNFELHHPFHLVADALARLTGIRGPRYIVSTACSSGGKTLAIGRRLILAGVADAVLTGSVDSLCQTTLRGFHSLSILSPEPCRPFSRERRGISIGEGAAFILLESGGEASVELLGVGESSDAYHMSSPDPQGRGARAAMSIALEQAGLSVSDVDNINAHGTGTKRNDEAESHAVYELFGDKVPIISTKGYTGHLLGAGGSTEAIFAALTIEQGWIPASLGADPFDEDLRINVATERLERPSRIAMSNSFGFGGSNVCVVLGASA